jgi:PhzF family phenazine biosynthesis protein
VTKRHDIDRARTHFPTRLLYENTLHGKAAAVVVLEQFLPDASLQAIAAENNLAETAFLVAAGTEHHLRWFTPTVEVKLCGHATLATAAVVMERLEPNREEVFQSLSGPLTVRRSGSRYVMEFPARRSDPVPAPAGLAEALGAVPVEVQLNSFNHLAVFEDPQVVRSLRPDMNAVAQIEREGVIVTAHGDPPYDFTSRYFAPAKGIPEDPVTGGAHCMLIPYWANRLGKTDFLGFQASSRGGEVICGLRGERVRLEGSCVFYLEGEIQI